MDTLEDLLRHDRVLVAGVGGGGDVVGAVPTRDLLRLHGADVLLGGLPWERVPHDPEPGPRRLDEVADLEMVGERVGLTRGGARGPGDVDFAESRAPRVLDEPVALLDVAAGPRRLAEGLETACRELGITAIVGVDAGGDALARGDEEGLRSPLADGLMLATLKLVDLPTAVGVVGWGSDGELSPASLEAGFARVASAGGFLGAWGITPATARRMDALLDEVPTEASRLPVDAARGRVGDVTIRDGRRPLHLSPAAAVTFLLDADAVAAQSDLVPLLRDAANVDAAEDALADAGVRSELAYERDWAARQRDDA